MTADPTDGAPATGSGVVTRRRLLLGAAGVTAAPGSGAFLLNRRGEAAAVGPTSPSIAAADRRRVRAGRTVTREITAAPARIDLGGRQVDTWAYDGQVPGPSIRLGVGDTLKLRLTNRLPEHTGTHWHGLAIRNDMDGVPGVTMPFIAARSSFDYNFVVPDPGTYWYHSHVGPAARPRWRAPAACEGSTPELLRKSCD